MIAEVYAAAADIGVTDRTMVWNTDLVETLEFGPIAQAVVTMKARRPARKAAARTPARTS
ncbi:MAG: hypothetical protein R3C55_17675 [Parvularculaceae bacterium]